MLDGRLFLCVGRKGRIMARILTRIQELNFELFVMDLAEGCKTKEDYEKLSEELHESIEYAIQDLCMDDGIEDYEPSY